MNRLIGFGIPVILLCLGIVPLRAADVFVVSDIYGIRPDGTCSETKDGTFGDLAKSNVHWKADTKTIRMMAAKNEEVAVQIVIPAEGKGYGGQMSDLAGPGTIPAERASFSAVAWVVVPIKKLAPDVVIPLDGSVKGIKRFDVPIAVEGLPKAGNAVGVMLFEVWVPKEAKAGLYKGTVSVMRGEQAIEKLNVELTVFDFAMPDMPTYALDLLAYGTPASGLVKPAGKVGEITIPIQGDGLNPKVAKVTDWAKKVDYQVYKLAADNRCFINVLPYHGQRGNPTVAYPVAGKGADAKITSYAEYDDYVGPILDGKTNKFGQPPAHFTLPFNVNYPHMCEGEPANQFDWMPFAKTIPEGPGKEPKLKEFEETNKAIAEQTVAHFAKKGWTKTRFEVYHNQKGDTVQAGRSGQRNRLPWKMDEPVAAADYQALRYMFNVARWAFASAEAKGVQVVTRIDIGHWHCDLMKTPDGKPAPCYKAKAYDKAKAEETLKAATDHWVMGLTHVDAASEKLKDYAHPKAKMMTYGTANGGPALLGHRGVTAGEGFMAARRGTVGHIIYKVNLGTDPNNADDGSDFLYRGDQVGVDGSLGVKRLKLYRNAVNEFDYILAARQKDAKAADAVVDKMTRIDVTLQADYAKTKSKGFLPTNNVEDYLAARAKLAEIITGAKAPAGLAVRGPSSAFAGCGEADKITGYD